MDGNIKHKSSAFSVIIIFILLILTGIPLIYLLNIELNPSAISSSLSVSFSWNNAEPRVIEEMVTSKLEALVEQVKGINKINSRSGNGSGKITVTLDKKANIDAIRFEISTLIRQMWTELPEGVSFPQLTVNRPDHEDERPVLSYTLSAPLSSDKVYDYAENSIRPSLSLIEGINKIEIIGASPYGWIIEYDNNKLGSLGVSRDEIKNAVINSFAQEDLGIGSHSGILSNPLKSNYDRDWINISNIPVVLGSSLSSGTHQDISKVLLSIPVKRSDNRIVYLNDIANIKYKEEMPTRYYRINGLNTINILVYAGSGENNLVLGNKIKLAMQQLDKALPAGYELIMSDDSTQYISHELHNIVLRSLFAFIILLVFILLATRSLKYGLLVFVMLIGNLSIAVIFYYLFRLELHLYALAGITVSFGLMTDNIIIMSDHLRSHGNRKAFLAILAGTMATVSALSIIFFLNEQIKADLVDFALVIIINQSVSLFTSLFVIPALMDKLKLTKNDNQVAFHGISKKKHKQQYIIRFTNRYSKIFLFLQKRRIIAIIIYILGFGIPIYLLPDKWDGNKWVNIAYNATLGHEWYKTNAKPFIDKMLGGALRLFTEKVYEGSYFDVPQETSLFITASMPQGTTLSQADAIMTRMETYLKQFKEISIFQTFVSSRNSSVRIYFKEEYRRSEFPYILKGQVVNEAVELGGAYWSVQGFGDAFNNSVYETTGNYAVKVTGYNYDRLNILANSLKTNFSKYERVKEIFIVSERTWYKPDNTEFIAQINKEEATVYNIGPNIAYTTLQNLSINQSAFNSVYIGRKLENISLLSDEYDKTDLWELARLPLKDISGIYRFNNMYTIKKESTSPVISKENQEYIIFMQFEFVGADKSARKYINQTIDDFKPQVPIGYNVSLLSDNRLIWAQQNKSQYWFLALIVIMIFFICSVLFESLAKPFAVILTIPVAYIGVFLTFYIFRLNFDQGGFASLVMITGLTVNASIYILNDYNNLKRSHSTRNIIDIRLYFKAFNYKIIPILLTVVSAVFGFVPFLIGEKQPFWYALAAGTIGGLVFSLIAIVFYLPLFLRLKNEIRYKRRNETIKE